VLVVGNLTVGGTGKTPLVIYLIEELRKQGFKPGVISRGYGGQASVYPCIVTPDTPASECGDEPALIVRRTSVPMVVGRNRQASIEKLLEISDIDIVLSDDGLQHLAMQRDIEICLLDATSLQRNTYLLPAGPYRESKSRLSSVDLVVEHGLHQDQGELFAMNLKPSKAKPVVEQSDGQSGVFDSAKPLHAVAGIGNPDRFFNTCAELGLNFEAHRFPDHYAYSFADIDFADAVVLMTEKDAVKCHDFADSRHWYLPVDATLSNDFALALTSKLAPFKSASVK